LPHSHITSSVASISTKSNTHPTTSFPCHVQICYQGLSTKPILPHVVEGHGFFAHLTHLAHFDLTPTSSPLFWFPTTTAPEARPGPIHHASSDNFLALPVREQVFQGDGCLPSSALAVEQSWQALVSGGSFQHGKVSTQEDVGLGGCQHGRSRLDVARVSNGQCFGRGKVEHGERCRTDNSRYVKDCKVRDRYRAGHPISVSACSPWGEMRRLEARRKSFLGTLLSIQIKSCHHDFQLRDMFIRDHCPASPRLASSCLFHRRKVPLVKLMMLSPFKAVDVDVDLYRIKNTACMVHSPWSIASMS